MFYLSPEGDRYYLGRAFSYYAVNDDGEFLLNPDGEKELFNYPGNRATAEVFEGLGFTAVVPQPRPDDSYYLVTGPDEEGNYIAVPRDLPKLKLSKIQEQLTTTQQLLTGTDWLFIRANEMSRGIDVAIPSAVITNRDEIRNVCGVNCDLISATEGVEELEALIKAPAEVLEDPEDIAAGFMPNPEPHLLAYPTLEEQVYLTRDLIAPTIAATQ